MFALKNRVQLIGHVGLQPEIRMTEAGKKMASFSVAINQVYKVAGGEKVTDTQWHRLVAWGKIADITEKLLSKGAEIAVEGRLVNRSYTDKTGNKRSSTEIWVNDFILLGPKKAAK